jgi:hypothetical protein
MGDAVGDQSHAGGSQDQDEETCYVWLLTTWIALRGRSAVP